MMKNQKYLKNFGSGITSLVLILIIIAAVNILLSGIKIRKDLTEEKLYTLSEGTKQIIKSIEEPITLKLFFNFSMPEVPAPLKQYARQVQDLLQEYKIVSRGKIAVEVLDPKPDSDIEEWAEKYGIAGQQISLNSDKVHFGIAAICGDKEASIPFIDPRNDQLLEYNITRLIYRLQHPEKPVIGLISSLPVMGKKKHPMAPPSREPGAKPWAIVNELRGDYSIRELEQDIEKIDADINTLVLIHPKDLSDNTLYAIDQFVLRGGHLIVFLDPFCLTEMDLSSKEQFGFSTYSSDIKKLLDIWGITYQADRIVADLEAATPVRSSQSTVEQNPMWLSLSQRNASKEDVLTAQIESLQLPFAGCFSGASSEDLTFTPLISSSPNSGTINSFAVRMGGDSIRREFRNGAVPLHLAVRLSGKFKTAFPNGKPLPKEQKDQKDQKAAAQSTEESLKEGKSTVILVGDVDFIYDRFCLQEINFFGFSAYQPVNDNAIFFANTLEQMAGSEHLISIRSRGKFNRPFDRVIALQQKASAQWIEREKELQAKLEETQRQINEMQTRKDSTQRFILSPEQKQAIEKFKAEEIRIKKELKTVRKNLRSDIETLGAWVKTINIALMPILLAISGTVYFSIRSNTR